MSIVKFVLVTSFLLFSSNCSTMMAEEETTSPAQSDSLEDEMDPDYMDKLLENEANLEKIEELLGNDTELESLADILKELQEGDDYGVFTTTTELSTITTRNTTSHSPSFAGRMAIAQGRNVNAETTSESITTVSPSTNETKAIQVGASTPSHDHGSAAAAAAEGESEAEDRQVPLPLHDPSRLGGTAKLSGVCDIALNRVYVLPIYARYMAGERFTTEEESLISYLNNNTQLRPESCYGYVQDPTNKNQSIVANFMECRQTNFSSGVTKGKCRCLNETDKNSVMHFRPEIGKEDTACEHPIDILLPRCDRKLWQQDVLSKLGDILDKLRQNRSDPTVVTTTFMSLQSLATSLRNKYDKPGMGLQKICFAEDFSMYCNNRQYCTCMRNTNLHFVRSKIVDRCVPINGSICDAGMIRADLCAQSTCQPLFSNTTLPGGPPSSSSGGPLSVAQACGGFEAWINAEDTAFSILAFHYHFYVILQLSTTWFISTVIQ